ncbi:dTDP-4-dehydrorhamnose reductase [Arenimonas composti]|uniref:dTDP-4-dehydrorhamnose reductase n=1 Tax=Arenimonas composti TR7-09 = DSM 18010 TaxID=1121013 RepID=A0A091BHP5_9GAMM|nr:dTDP-4-dehydrorhamnose reductase [Arenimonas composti]KFN51032.1 hypothetical protein P873_04610 [Arenimonas composti TR7-09 = DSM 18010]
MRILLLGADGQVGSALRRSLAPFAQVLSSTIDGRLPDGGQALPADFMQPGALPELVAATAPALVINAAAWTAVDAAETAPEAAFRVNAGAVAELAGACAAKDLPLLHFSTDYVFAGDAVRPWREDDVAAPGNVYGASKLAGEQAVRAAGGPHGIFRLSWVYAPEGKNFLETMLRLARERDELRVVADQTGAPTPAAWIADAVARVIRSDRELRGTWHLAAAGATTWHGFAEAIVADALAAGLLARAPRVTAIASADWPTPARRPANSRLDGSRLAADFGLRLPDWRQGVRETIAALRARHG